LAKALAITANTLKWIDLISTSSTKIVSTGTVRNFTALVWWHTRAG
jgi:hypothetical protein